MFFGSQPSRELDERRYVRNKEKTKKKVTQGTCSTLKNSTLNKNHISGGEERWFSTVFVESAKGSTNTSLRHFTSQSWLCEGTFRIRPLRKARLEWKGTVP